MNKIHTLKTWPTEYADMKSGLKTFEIRKNDRDFQVGDILVLQEYNPETEKYTGEMHSYKITYMIQGQFGLPDDMCVMGVECFNEAFGPFMNMCICVRLETHSDYWKCMDCGKIIERDPATP